MEQETVKLLNVLRRIARAAGYAAWTKPGPDATQFCIAQYNRVLARLTELEPSVKPLFTPLTETASPEVIRSWMYLSSASESFFPSASKKETCPEIICKEPAARVSSAMI